MGSITWRDVVAGLGVVLSGLCSLLLGVVVWTWSNQVNEVASLRDKLGNLELKVAETQRGLGEKISETQGKIGEQAVRVEMINKTLENTENNSKKIIELLERRR